MAMPFGEKRKTRSIQENWIQTELRMEELKHRLSAMESQINTVDSTLDSKLNNIEHRFHNIAYKKKNEPSAEETLIVKEIKNIVENYPYSREKDHLDTQLQTLTLKLDALNKNHNNCNLFYRKESD
jgi:ABC-type phosphate transport system auxiliary subunit